MNDEPLWRILGLAPLEPDASGQTTPYRTPLIECPGGHRRRASHGEMHLDVLPCHECDRSFPVDWQVGWERN